MATIITMMNLTMGFMIMNKLKRNKKIQKHKGIINIKSHPSIGHATVHYLQLLMEKPTIFLGVNTQVLSMFGVFLDVTSIQTSQTLP
jgi:hypothetical protein